MRRVVWGVALYAVSIVSQLPTALGAPNDSALPAGEVPQIPATPVGPVVQIPLDIPVSENADEPQAGTADEATSSVPAVDEMGEPFFPDDALLVLSLQYERFLLSDGFIAYDYAGTLYVPLGQLMSALEFPIFVAPDSKTASGTFLDERAFELDLDAGVVRSDGDRFSLFPTDVIQDIDDIYVKQESLSAWFPLQLEFSSKEQLIKVSADEPLPVEQRFLREQRYGGLGAGNRDKRSFPRHQTPYGLADVPFLDVSLSTDYIDTPLAGAEWRSSHSFLLTGDLAYMNATLSLSGDNNDALRDARFTLDRSDPDAGLLGPLSASQVQIGDTFSPQLPLSARSARGRGMVISSFPLQSISEFDRVTLRGELPSGWEIELYRNDILLDFQRGRTDGLFEFEDVELTGGMNLLRLVSYGPQGQRRVEERRFFIGAGLVRPGKFHYRLSALQNDSTIIPSRDTTTLENEGDPRVSLEMEYGVSRSLSIAGSAVYAPDTDDLTKQKLFANAGLRFDALGAYSQIDVSWADDGGMAYQAGTQFPLFGYNVLAEHAELRDYISEQFDDPADPTVRETTLRADGSIGGDWLPPLPISIRATREEHESGRRELRVSNRLSTGFWRLRASNQVEWERRTDRFGVAEDRVDGDFLLSGRFPDVAVRGSVDYDIAPVFRARDVAVTGDWDFGERISMSSIVRHELLNQRTTEFGAGLNWLFDVAAFGFEGLYGTDNEFRLGMSLSLSVGHEPRERRWVMAPRALAGSGAASALAFLDRDADGKFDLEDEPLEGVRFQRFRDAETNAQGVAFLPGLSANQPVPVAIDPDSLEDPFWVPAKEGYEVVPRPGHASQLLFPVTETGEVDGTVYATKRGARVAVSNAQVQLIAKDGSVLQEVSTVFDGFYLFEKVPLGSYLVRIAPEQVERLALVQPAPKRVTLSSEENMAIAVDFSLSYLADKPKAPEEPEIREVREARGGGGPGAFRIQISSSVNKDLSTASAEHLNRSIGKDFGVTFKLTEVDLGKKGIFYRVQSGPFERRADAQQICSAAKKAGSPCLVASY